MEVIMIDDWLEEPLPRQRSSSATRAARRPKPDPRPKTQVDEADRTAASPPSTAITDWYAEAERAAEEALESARQREALRSFTHRSAPTPEVERPGIFGSEKRNRRAGISDGPDRIWVTDNCYFEWDRSAPKPEFGPKVRLKQRTCKPPPTGGGAHMFEELRPEYLKPVPESSRSTQHGTGNSQNGFGPAQDNSK